MGIGTTVAALVLLFGSVSVEDRTYKLLPSLPKYALTLLLFGITLWFMLTQWHEFGVWRLALIGFAGAACLAQTIVLAKSLFHAVYRHKSC